MTGFQTNLDELKKLEVFLSLNQEELRIYNGLISLGSMATLGQISTVTGVDIVASSGLLDSLVGRGYVKRVPGPISRYYALEPFLDTYIQLFDPKGFASLIDKITGSLKTSPISLIDDQEMFYKYLEENLNKRKDELLGSVELSQENHKLVDEVLRTTVKELSDTAFSITQDMEKRARKILSRSANSFQKDVKILFTSIAETRRSLNRLFDLSRTFQVDSGYATDVLIGESAVLVAMKDIITRCKSSLLVFMPLPEIKSLMGIIELSNHRLVKIEVVGKLANAPPTILDKLRSEGIAIKLSQSEDVDFWALVMDDSELLLAPQPPADSDLLMTGVYTTHAQLISLITDHLRKFQMRGRPL